MDVRPEIQIQSMIKAMIDVVLPAVDPEHKMAQEQARLVIGTLQLIAKRLPIAYRYDVDELRRYIGLAHQLMDGAGSCIDPQALTQLEYLASRGAGVLDGARSDPADVETAAFELRAAVSVFVERASMTGTPVVKKTVRKLVLAASKVELQRERALVMEMGFESDPSKRPPPILSQLPPLPTR